ncbi:MAG: HPr family phosphocarrier protein [Pseudomonadota bacterium]
MLTQEVEIINKLGLHARAAAKLVKLASRFESDVEIQRDGRKVNGKSIMGVMLLAAAQGTSIELIISGEDETDAMQEITTLINDYFGEGE